MQSSSLLRLTTLHAGSSVQGITIRERPSRIPQPRELVKIRAVRSIHSFTDDVFFKLGQNAVPAAHLAKFLTLDRAFDATAAHAIGAPFVAPFVLESLNDPNGTPIGMIVQELVRDTVTKSMTPPVPQSHIQGKRKREGPKRYTSPSLTLSKRRVRSSPTSRPPKSTKQRRTVRKTTRKSLRGDQLDETTLSMDEATVLVEDEAEELEDTSENDAQDEMDIEVSQ